MGEIKENNPKRPAKEIDKKIYLSSLDKEDCINVLEITKMFEEFCKKENKDHSILVAVGGSVIEETQGTKRDDIDFLIVSDKEATFENFTKKFADVLLKGVAGSIIEKITEPYYDKQIFGVLDHTGSVKLKFSNSTTRIEIFSNPMRNCQEQIDSDKDSITQGGVKPNDFCILNEYYSK